MKTMVNLFKSHKAIKGCLARDADNNPVSAENPAATQFCLVGGAIHVYGFGDEMRSAVWKLEKYLGDFVKELDKLDVLHAARNVVDFNNHPDTTQADIIALCEKAGV